MTDNASQDRYKLFSSLLISAIFVVLMWGVKLSDWWFELDLGVWGIYPRRIEGLIGILSSPFIHSSHDWSHIQSNSLPILFLMGGILYFYRKIAWKVIASIWLATNVWVWAAARPSFHIGASGLIYGFAFFVFFSGVFRKDIRSITLGLLVSFLYGGIVWGVFPGDPGVSWEAHLFGALSGVIFAWLYRKEAIPPRKKYDWEDENEDEDTNDSNPNNPPEIWDYNKMYPPPDVN